MSALFASGRIVDLILVLILFEGLVLTLVHRQTGRGLPPSDLIGFLLSGFLLMLALRAALVGAWWGWISLALTGALVAHLADLAWRWRRAGRRPPD
ncbi:MAG: hypothetical protein ACUVT0_04260 [Thermochromatium sp.]